MAATDFVSVFAFGLTAGLTTVLAIGLVIGFTTDLGGAIFAPPFRFFCALSLFRFCSCDGADFELFKTLSTLAAVLTPPFFGMELFAEAVLDEAVLDEAVLDFAGELFAAACCAAFAAGAVLLDGAAERDAARGAAGIFKVLRLQDGFARRVEKTRAPIEGASSQRNGQR